MFFPLLTVRYSEFREQRICLVRTIALVHPGNGFSVAVLKLPAEFSRQQGHLVLGTIQSDRQPDNEFLGPPLFDNPPDPPPIRLVVNTG